MSASNSGNATPRSEQEKPPAEEASPNYDDDFTEDEASPSKEQPTSKEPSPARDASRSSSRNSDTLPAATNNNNSNNNTTQELSPNSQQRRRQQQQKFPPISTISYPPRQADLSVADFLDPSKPLVKSTLPLTKPHGPTFVEETTAEKRKLVRTQHKMESAQRTSQLNAQRQNERKYLKAQYEFEREKKLAEKAIYHRERTALWSQRLSASPLAVDLVADNERIEEEAYVREREERRRRVLADRKKRRIKNEIIVKALAEVPLLEEARRQKREMLDEERREKALRDVQRVEAIQERKHRDMSALQQERQAKLDQRIMGTAGNNRR